MKDPAPRLGREVIAMRVAREFRDGEVVNLGIGIPTLCSDFVPPGVQLMYHSESGLLNCGPLADEGEGDVDLINAGGQFLSPIPGMAYFDSAEAFAMIRGGHIDVTALGALQVSASGDLANWFLPARGVGNVGGAMDLAAGAKRVIVAMEHNGRDGTPKIVPECSYPLTGKGCVSLIVTDIAVIEVLPGGAGLQLIEHAPGWDAASIKSQTEAVLTVSPDLAEITLV
ncbi:MAG: 3-oxoacid CoA-transferase subunit B [Dehalococcoidia bacterium]|jgi:3-oxoacid CoA-transferase subunit B|nr:3-oxoacid CoA-transferase subunit B [Dehalococcoidia bacterium]